MRQGSGGGLLPGEVRLRSMTDGDIQTVLDLWFGTDGLMMRSIDSEPSIRRFLERNPGLSFVAEVVGEVRDPAQSGTGPSPAIVGAVICGHDGRRGYLHHLAVEPRFRQKGIGRSLADRCLSALEAIGITKCHLFVRAINPEAVGFWRKVGWHMRDDTHMLSRNLTDDLNA